MDWARIKTIFIISFLILDIFLGYQFADKRNSSQLDVITEATIDEQLAADEITYHELPKAPVKDTYISGKSEVFSTKDISDLKNQDVTIVDSSFIHSTFQKPIPLPATDKGNRIIQIVKENVLNGEDYSFWKEDKDTGTYTFYQTFKNRVFYNNLSARLILYTNAKHEIIGYNQTLLNEIEVYNEKQETLPAIKALENLYKKNLLLPGSHVSKVEFGYYTLVSFTASQVLTPTWHIVVDNKTDFYVNAFEGQIIDSENKILE